MWRDALRSSVGRQTIEHAIHSIAVEHVSAFGFVVEQRAVGHCQDLATQAHVLIGRNRFELVDASHVRAAVLAAAT